MRKVLLLVLLLLSLTAPAAGHTGGIAAIVATEPVQPAPGQPALLKVELFDPYMVRIESGRVRAGMAPDGKPAPPPIALAETSAGTYTGTVAAPEAGIAVITVEADLVDGPWRGSFPVRIGPDGGEIDGLTVQLVPVEAGAGHGAPGTPTQPGTGAARWAPWLAVGAAVLLLTTWLRTRRR